MPKSSHEVFPLSPSAQPYKILTIKLPSIYPSTLPTNHPHYQPTILTTQQPYNNDPTIQYPSFYISINNNKQQAPRLVTSQVSIAHDDVTHTSNSSPRSNNLFSLWLTGRPDIYLQCRRLETLRPSTYRVMMSSYWITRHVHSSDLCLYSVLHGA